MTANPDALTHDHVYLAADHDRLGRRTLAVVLLTAATMAAEIAAGLWTGSMALLADGLHMATHAGVLGLAAAAYAFARARARDPSFAFGTGKVGDLAGFASALTLGIVALGVAAESLGRLWAPQAVAFGPALLVAVLSLLVNIASAAILGRPHGHDHGHDHGHHHGDTNHRAAVAHVITDAITSVLAILALAAGSLWGAAWTDPAVGLLGAALILGWALRLLRDASAVLLDRADGGLVAAVRGAAGGARVLDCHVWRIGPGAHAAVLSVEGPAATEALRRAVAAVPGVAHVTVEVRAGEGRG